MRRQSINKLFILSFTFLLCACQSLNIPQYDAKTDQAVTKIQTQVNSLFISIKENLHSKKSAERYYQKDYQKILVRLHVLLTRQEALPHNTTTREQVELLIDSIEKLQQRHKLGFKNEKELKALQHLINRHFRAILTLELAKRKD